MIAALFVEPGGIYYGVPGIEPWGPPKDARDYDGPFPVIAHPPCARWGKYWFGSPSGTQRFEKGDDGGCFASALDSVRRFGGVLEHPKGSKAWNTFGLLNPEEAGGWTRMGPDEWVCCVEQGHYGHRARKASWLYVVAPEEPQALLWGPSVATKRVEQMGRLERVRTPLAFREALSGLAFVGGS